MQQVRPAKYVPETISYFADFSDQLENGEVIQGSPTITVYLVDGDDTNPSTMLYQGATILGNVVEQRIRQGIAGNIYSIVFSINTDHSHTYEIEFYLAILPADTTVVPDYQPAWLTTFPYPYYLFDSLQGTPSLQVVNLLWNPNYHENLQGTPQLVFVNMYGGSVSYSNPHEDLQGIPGIFSVNLFGGEETYNIPAEGLDTNVAIIFVNMYGGAISYEGPAEGLQATPSIVGATLS